MCICHVPVQLYSTATSYEVQVVVPVPGTGGVPHTAHSLVLYLETVKRETVTVKNNTFIF